MEKVFGPLRRISERSKPRDHDEGIVVALGSILRIESHHLETVLFLAYMRPTPSFCYSCLRNSYLQTVAFWSFYFYFKSQVNLSLKSLQTNGFLFLNNSYYVSVTLKVPLRQSYTPNSISKSFWMLSMKSHFRH